MPKWRVTEFLTRHAHRMERPASYLAGGAPLL